MLASGIDSKTGTDMAPRKIKVCAEAGFKRKIAGYEVSCVRLRTSYPNHVWSYDFVFVLNAYGGKIRMLTMIDEYTRGCLTILCARRIGAIQVIEQLANVILRNSLPEYIRSDNRPEFVAKELRKCLGGMFVETTYTEPRSPWENGYWENVYCESFNGSFRDNLLDGEVFYSLQEPRVIVGKRVKN